MKVLSVCGSLRAASLNAALLRTVARVSPAHIDVRACTGIGELPFFNPDLAPDLPTSVIHLRAQVARADALVIASPEYAHGMTGVIKNAMDWLVGFEPFRSKPVAIFNASPWSHLADASLKETLRAMSVDLVKAACIDLPLIGEHITELDMVRLPTIVQPVQAALGALHRHVSPSTVFQLNIPSQPQQFSTH